MRKNTFLAAAMAKSLNNALEEHAADAGGESANDQAMTTAVQGVVAPISATDGAPTQPVSVTDAQATGDESTIVLPEVDSVAELQEHVGSLEDENYNNDQGALQDTSETFSDEVSEAVDVVASLEMLAASIDYAIANEECNRSTNAAFYQAMTEACKRSGMYTQGYMNALEDNAAEMTDAQASGEEGAAGIGERVKQAIGSGVTTIIEGIKKFVGWVINVFQKLTTSAQGLAGKFEEFEKTQLNNLKGGDISSGVLIQRLSLVRGGGDAERQFGEFINYIHNNLARVLAGPMSQLLDRIMRELNAGSITNTVAGDAIDRIITQMYPESINNEDLRGTDIGTDWAQGSTPDLIGGLRAWVASNHNLMSSDDVNEKMTIKSGISHDLETETPEVIGAATATTARSGIRSIVSILKHWKEMKLVNQLGSIMSVVTNFKAGGGSSAIKRNDQGMTERTALQTYSQVLSAFAGKNTLSLIRHALHVFALYLTYLKASAVVGNGAADGGQEAPAAAAA